MARHGRNTAVTHACLEPTDIVANPTRALFPLCPAWSRENHWCSTWPWNVTPRACTSVNNNAMRRIAHGKTSVRVGDDSDAQTPIGPTLIVHLILRALANANLHINVDKKHHVQSSSRVAMSTLCLARLLLPLVRFSFLHHDTSSSMHFTLILKGHTKQAHKRLASAGRATRPKQ